MPHSWLGYSYQTPVDELSLMIHFQPHLKLWNEPGQCSRRSRQSGFYPRSVDVLPQWTALLVLYSHQSLVSELVCILHVAQVWNQIFPPRSWSKFSVIRGGFHQSDQENVLPLSPWHPVTCFNKCPWTISTSGDCHDAFIVYKGGKAAGQPSLQCYTREMEREANRERLMYEYYKVRPNACFPPRAWINAINSKKHYQI